MVARDVMKAWQISRQQQPGPRSIHQPGPAGPDIDELRPSDPGNVDRQGLDGDLDDDAFVQVKDRDGIVPRKRGLQHYQPQEETFWNSHLFWKGILVGALSVVLVKTALAVQAPQGISWYGF